MKLHVIFQRIAVQIVVVTLLVCVVSCKKDTKGTDIIRNGKWQGSYKTVNTSDAIIFNVKDGKITSDGSTISDFSGRICCMWVKIYWPSTTSIHTETSFLQDIPVSDNSFCAIRILNNINIFL